MEVREQILQLALDTIQRDGIDAVSFRILADKVGVKSSSVHYHFPKKDDLILELTQRYTAHFDEVLTTISSKSSTARLRLRRLVAAFRNTKKQDKVCYCGMLAAISSRLDDESRSSARDFFSLLRGWVQQVLEEGVEAGEFDAMIKPKALAGAFVSTLEGALLIDHLHGTTEHLDASAKLIDVLLE